MAVMLRPLLLLVSAGVALAAAPHARPQEFPRKPVRIISPYPTGITPDAAARLVADKLTKAWGQNVIVDPRPGANGFIAIGIARKAEADGHQLLLAGNAHLAINPNLFRSVPYDPVQDFVPLSTIYRAPFFVAVAAAGPLRSVPDLIARAKASPGKVSYSSPYIGSPPHLGAALLAYMTGTQMLHVAYKEGPQIYIAVANGEVDWALGTLGSTNPLVGAGRLKLIAIAAKSRLPSHPDVPTVVEAGGPAGYEVDTWVSFVAPRGTPAALARRISADIASALAQPDLQERYRATLGVEPFATAPAQMGELLRADLKSYGALIKRTGITAE
jgi:tripartite-type tricarboxylate transporter receptor subunit TctC